MKRCTKTMSGKHKWRTIGWGIYGLPVDANKVFLKHPVCENCGMIDDRPKKEKK